MDNSKSGIETLLDDSYISADAALKQFRPEAGAKAGQGNGKRLKKLRDLAFEVYSDECFNSPSANPNGQELMAHAAKNRRTGDRCKNPAAFGCKTCRYHGARQILSDNDHPIYKHGQRTNAAIESYQNKVMELDELEDLALSVGLVGNRRRGRRSKS